MEKRDSFGRGERRTFAGREGSDRRNDRRDGDRKPRFGGERNTFGGDNDRPRFRRNDNEGERPRFNRNSRPDGEGDRPRFNREKSFDGERQRFNHNDERPHFNRNSRPDGEGDRPRFNREKSFDGERPRFGNNRNGDRPRFGRNSRPDGENDRPRFNREKSFGGDRQRNTPRRDDRKGKIDFKLFEESAPAETTQPAAKPEMPAAQKMRLNRYIAMSGVCSRREADDLIKDGHIKVNGKVVTEMGIVLAEGDKVEYDGKQLTAEKKVYVLLNKPKDTVTTTDDPEERRTVMDLVEDAGEERIYPVGRLDRNTTGVLLLTNDGEIAERLMHPRYGVRKIYHVFLDKHVTENDMERMVNGLHLEDGPISVDDVRYVDPTDKKQVGVEIHSGRNRIVRRIFEHLGFKVEKLDRVYFAGLTKLNLPRGRWRYLTDKEVNKLKAGFFK